MNLKIENKASVKIPGNVNNIVAEIFQVIPREHMRGLQRVVFVDQISMDAKLLAVAGNNSLPGLYHPKQGISQPWLEIAVGTLLPSDSFFKRLAARLNFKANLAYLLISLQAQHYYLTLAHGIKKNQYESKIRTYSEKYHEIWRESQGGWRAKVFKPLRPFMEKWAKKLKTKYETEQRKR
jgi:hypothetical protein